MEFIVFLCAWGFIALCLGTWGGIQLYKEEKAERAKKMDTQ